MMYNHPKAFLLIQEQDRERAMAQRALERAAREGQTDPGLVRGGISSIVKTVRGAAAGAAGLFGGTRPSTGLSGSTEA